MSLTTLTSKGQVTIPKEIRDELELRAGDKLDFQIGKPGEIRVVAMNKRSVDVFGMLGHRASKAVSPEEMNKGLRKAFRDKHL